LGLFVQTQVEHADGHVEIEIHFAIGTLGTLLDGPVLGQSLLVVSQMEIAKGYPLIHLSLLGSMGSLFLVLIIVGILKFQKDIRII